MAPDDKRMGRRPTRFVLAAARGLLEFGRRPVQISTQLPGWARRRAMHVGRLVLSQPSTPITVDERRRQAESLVGSVLRGKYEVLGVAGAGGQGYVLRALDIQDGHQVALKLRVLSSGVRRSEVAHEAALLLYVVGHDRLPTLRDSFFVGPHHYMVMDWVDGQPLTERLRDERTSGLAYGEVVTVIRHVADALDHLHRQRPSIVHGDVKPSNIILSASHGATLVDFGVSGFSRGGKSLGLSAPYVAPELAGGDVAPTVEGDVFSLAVTTFQLLTGVLPVRGALPDWPGLSERQRALARKVIGRGLSLDPAARPSSAAEFAGALWTCGECERRLDADWVFCPSCGSAT